MAAQFVESDFESDFESGFEREQIAFRSWLIQITHVFRFARHSIIVDAQFTGRRSLPQRAVPQL